MKKYFLLFPILFSLVSCNDTPSESFSVYSDESRITSNEFAVESNNIQTTYSDNYQLSLTLSITNLTTSTKSVSFKNISLIKEKTGSSYRVNASDGVTSPLVLDSGIRENVLFTSTIPTSLEENYYFSITFGGILYKLFLYEKPDELREDMTVFYTANNKVLHTEIVKQGRAIGKNYLYQSKDHQEYVESWKTSSNETFTAATIINEDMTVYGTIKNNIRTITTSSDLYSQVSGINKVPSDGVLVIADTYRGKEVTIGNYAIRGNSDIWTIFLPKTIHQIYAYNFVECSNLSVICFAGTQEEWNAIPKSDTSAIPSKVRMVYNCPFTD